VRVPKEVGKGKAEVVLSFPDWAGAKVAPATFGVPVVDSPPPDQTNGEEGKPGRSSKSGLPNSALHPTGPAIRLSQRSRLLSRPGG
jgi:hypothetical protein